MLQLKWQHHNELIYGVTVIYSPSSTHCFHFHYNLAFSSHPQWEITNPHPLCPHLICHFRVYLLPLIYLIFWAWRPALPHHTVTAGFIWLACYLLSFSSFQGSLIIGPIPLRSLLYAFLCLCYILLVFYYLQASALCRLLIMYFSH